ncbi:hypothetical protein OS175_03520 [Marinicella sp. S1101]|nr:hypothetical protein [Marinicella marina]MDJ1139753.1 hypothetical protein [Marinicella marina]
MAWFIYLPGLSGSFIFDDFHSLAMLKTFNDGMSWDALIQYLLQSDTGQLKRPVSMLSFLLDAQQWPADPYSFKRTNLIIHVLNGCLLFALIRLLFATKPDWSRYQIAIAFFAAGTWLVHPFLVSTTLYVVQRMAMLPLTFMLLGLLILTWSRIRQDASGFKQQFLSVFIAVPVMTFLAVLSKENGALFLLLVLLYDRFILQSFMGLPALLPKISFWLIKLPAAVFVIAILIKVPDLMGRYEVRDFTVIERIMTQMRVLSDYLYQLFFPRYLTYGVFTDAFPVSKGLLQPITTLVATAFIIGILVIAYLLRHRFVWFSFAVFFYFTAQLLESTIIPLEIYFEHRNYLASIFLTIPVIMPIIKLVEKSKIFWLVPISMLLFLSFTTYIKSNMWGNNMQLHQIALQRFPASIRAGTFTADLYQRQGYTIQALDVMQEAAERHDKLRVKFNHHIMMCDLQRLSDIHFDALLKSMTEVEFELEDVVSFNGYYQRLLERKCESLQGNSSNDYPLQIWTALSKNSFINKDYAQPITEYFFATRLVFQDEFDQALELYTMIYDNTGEMGASINSAVMLFNAGAYNQALKLVRHLQNNHSKQTWMDFNYDEIQNVLSGLEQSIRKAKGDYQ